MMKHFQAAPVISRDARTVTLDDRWVPATVRPSTLGSRFAGEMSRRCPDAAIWLNPAGSADG